MTEMKVDEQVRGKTMLWKWTEGPTAGQTHEHVFEKNGTMTWRVLDGPKAGTSGTEKRYGAVQLADRFHLVSYLAASGFTITVALNFDDGTIVGFASSAKDWFPLRGTFEPPV